MLALIQFVLQEKCQKTTQKCANNKRPSLILAEQCCHIHLTVLTLNHQLFPVCPVRTLLHRWWGTAVLCISTCRGGRATSTRQEGGRWLLTKMEIALQNSYAFSHAGVKFCEMFRCPAWKYHKMKNRMHCFLTAYYTLVMKWEAQVTTVGTCALYYATALRIVIISVYFPWVLCHMLLSEWAGNLTCGTASLFKNVL